MLQNLSMMSSRGRVIEPVAAYGAKGAPGGAWYLFRSVTLTPSELGVTLPLVQAWLEGELPSSS